jgi:hypothetical protein
MISDHQLRELLVVRVSLLLGDLCRLDLEHVAHCGFFSEVFGHRRDTEQS